MSERGRQLVRNDEKRRQVRAQMRAAMGELYVATHYGNDEQLAALDLVRARKALADIETCKTAMSELLLEYAELASG